MSGYRRYSDSIRRFSGRSHISRIVALGFGIEIFEELVERLVANDEHGLRSDMPGTYDIGDTSSKSSNRELFIDNDHFQVKQINLACHVRADMIDDFIDGISLIRDNFDTFDVSFIYFRDIQIERIVAVMIRNTHGNR